MAHTSVVRLRTGTPSSRARSVFSAAARTAVPASDRLRNQASAPTTTGTTPRISRWLPVIERPDPPRTRGTRAGSRTLPGSGSIPRRRLREQELDAAEQLGETDGRHGRGPGAAPSANRRTIPNSTSAPTAKPSTGAVTSDSAQGSSQVRNICIANTPATPAIAPLAKLMMRLARQMRMRPTAVRPVADPRMAPTSTSPTGAPLGSNACGDQPDDTDDGDGDGVRDQRGGGHQDSDRPTV